jgi:Zn-dependent protease with chaperone function
VVPGVLLTVALVVTAVTVSVVSPVFPVFVLSLLLLAVAFLIRPRFGRMPKGALLLTRTDAPELYRLLDRVADEVGARRVDVIAIDRFFNASYAAVGLRRRRVVTIGLPLWNALSPEERISVLGHEFGHGVNRDSRHLLVVGTALQTLGRLYALLRRDREWEHRVPGARIPALELERRRRISAITEHRVDSSHPPTRLRIELLRGLPTTEPTISLTAQETDTIEKELGPTYAKIAVDLAAPYRAAHYES